MLLAVGDIDSTQSRPTDNTLKALHHLLDYAYTHPNATIRYTASPMIMNTHSDASYLSAPKSRSRVGGYFFMGTSNAITTPLNGPIHCEAKILRHVMSSAAEAEIGALFVNAKSILSFRVTLAEMGHPQPLSPIQTDNNTASGFAQANIKQKRMRTLAMRYYWLQDQHDLTLDVFWRPKEFNAGDYLTKHHPDCHHKCMRSIILNQSVHA